MLDLDHGADPPAIGLAAEQVQRLGQRYLEIERTQRERGGHREGPEPAQELLDPVDLLHRDLREGGAELVVVGPLGKELGERLDRHQRVPDLVGDTGRHRAECREAISAPLVLFEGLEPGVVVEHGDRPADRALVIVKRRRVDHQWQRPPLGERHRHLRLGLVMLDEARAEHGADRRVQDVERAAHDVGRLDTEDALGGGVERRDDAVVPGGDHS